ncbi:cobalamin binding intrinsic factor-like isoform 1-T2 [Pholidichthys leucotaenia]
MKMPTLLSVLLLLASGVPAGYSHRVGGEQIGCSSQEKGQSFLGPDKTPISVLVTNAITPAPNLTYSTYVVFRGILLGGLRRLQNSSAGFNFTYTEDQNYGPFLQSVNGVKGSFENRTYWELLVNKTDKTVIRPDVGIGCYIPNENEQIILKYTNY